MAQATTYNIYGIREDLTDFLTILEPEDTPKLSMFAKTKRPTNTYQEWQADNLSTPSFAPVLEGSDVTAFSNKAVNRARFGNYVQWFRRPWMVSRITEAVEVAGVSNEVANAKAKAMRELKRDIEAAIGSDNDMQADNGAVGWQTRGLGSWIASAAQTTNAVPANYLSLNGAINTTTSGAQTESTFNATFQALYEVMGGKHNYYLYAGPTLKSTISKFQRQTATAGFLNYMVTQDATQNEITLNVEVYDGDFHKVNVVPDLFNGVVTDAAVNAFVTALSRCRGYIIDPELVGVGYMIGMESVEYPDLGGGRRGAVQAVLTLMVKNPRGLGKFSGAT